VSKKIYEKDHLYNFLRPIVDTIVRSCYRDVQVTGLENIPTDGAVILAPNHCNTLMDALVVLRTRREETVFGARADIFNNKTAAKFLHFLRILPMVRKRDGLRNVAKNHESNDMIIETLENGVKYCMFCEGTHRPKHSMLPVTKGIVRIALAANEKFGDKKPVYIVPMGIEYGDYFRAKSTSLVQHGKPINVTEYVAAHKDDNEADIYRALMWQLGDAISSLITFIPDNEMYSAKWTLTRIWAKRGGSPKKRLERDRAAAAKAELASEELLASAEAFEQARKAAKVSIKSFGHKALGFNLVWKTLLGILMLPLFTYSLLTAGPSWLTSYLVGSKVKDRAFMNTVRFACKFIWLPILVIVYGVLMFVFLPWYVALVAFLLAIHASSLYYLMLEYYRIYFSDWRLLAHRSLIKQYWDLKEQQTK